MVHSVGFVLYFAAGDTNPSARPSSGFPSSAPTPLGRERAPSPWASASQIGSVDARRPPNIEPNSLSPAPIRLGLKFRARVPQVRALRCRIPYGGGIPAESEESMGDHPDFGGSGAGGTFRAVDAPVHGVGLAPPASEGNPAAPGREIDRRGFAPANDRLDTRGRPWFASREKQSALQSEAAFSALGCQLQFGQWS